MIDIIKKSMQIILLQTENACIVKKGYIVIKAFLFKCSQRSKVCFFIDICLNTLGRECTNLHCMV